MINLGFSELIALEAILSFGGLGVTPSIAGLGYMIQSGRAHIDPFWYQLASPGGILALLVLAFAFVGDGLRVAFDPRTMDR